MVRRLIALFSAMVVAVGAWFTQPFLASAGLNTTNHVTLVLGHPTRLTVTLYDVHAKIGNGATSNRVMVAKIVSVLNEADVPPRGAVACPVWGHHATLRFQYRNGDTWTVYFDGCWGLSTHGKRATALGDPPVYSTLPGLLNQVAGVKPSRRWSEVDRATRCYSAPRFASERSP